jgi:L-2,4-diaminobutyrate decarboxylase
LFLDGSRAAASELRRVVASLLDALESAQRPDAFPKLSSDALAEIVGALDPLPDDGVPLAPLLAEIGESVLANGVQTSSPRTAAHLHAPPLITAAAAELVIGATNQSIDSFDQAPAATHVEDRLVRRLAEVLGLPETASGVLTAGGTSSNLLGLLLAREHTSRTKTGRIVTSAAAHVSVRQAAFVLGLGRDAVVPVATDHRGRMDVVALDGELLELGGNVMAIVGTAGTTDTGAIDPLDALADQAAELGCWFHVDAAVGSGLALSERLRPLLRGIERADSITADLHKLWWQPISASALLVRDGAAFDGLREPADYLNRPEDKVLNLVERSLDTSRRFDALKVLISLRSVGRRRLGELVEHIVSLTTHAAQLIHQQPDLELLRSPETVTVLFRCRPGHVPSDQLDTLNTAVQQDLLATGQAVIGRTKLDGTTALKLTLVNPLMTPENLTELVDLIAARGRNQ